jgi:pilus assembly protein CpaE
VVPFWPGREGVGVGTRADGQAAVEMVALLPWVAAVLLVAWQFVLAGDARSSAAIAARAGARAVAVGADPAAAARERLPRRLRRGLRVETGEGGSVSVSVRVPALAGAPELGRVEASAALGAVR